MALRADGMKNALTLGAVIEPRIHRSAALWAHAHYRLSDHEVDDVTDGIRDEEHKNRPEHVIHPPALRVAVNVPNEQQEHTQNGSRKGGYEYLHGHRRGVRVMTKSDEEKKCLHPQENQHRYDYHRLGDQP